MFFDRNSLSIGSVVKEPARHGNTHIKAGSHISRTLLIIIALLLTSCASPTRRIDEMAGEWNLEKQILQGGNFELIAYRNRIALPANKLHIYLEGDGTPWITRTRIAQDPTPRNPLALHLMALDPIPALYLTRPCYNGNGLKPGCNPWLWTSGRYSELVVSSMTTALLELIQSETVHEIVLIGYSGGGVLAWLLAQRIAEVQALVTIAANLDIDRWTDLHGYSRLAGSLNPATGPPMRPWVQQWHLVGKADTNVPPSIIASLSRQIGTKAHVSHVASDHACCWLQLWPEVLRQLNQATPVKKRLDDGIVRHAQRTY